MRGMEEVSREVESVDGGTTGGMEEEEEEAEEHSEGAGEVGLVHTERVVWSTGHFSLDELLIVQPRLGRGIKLYKY